MKKRILSLILVCAALMSMAAPAFAAEAPGRLIAAGTEKNATPTMVAAVDPDTKVMEFPALAYATTADGFEDKGSAGTVSTIYDKGQTLYSASDLATITGLSDAGKWKETESQFAQEMRRNKGKTEIVPAPCFVVTLKDGYTYEIGEGHMFRVNFAEHTIEQSYTTSDMQIKLHGGELYMDKASIQSLFPSAVFQDDQIIVLTGGKQLNICKNLTKPQATAVTNALLLLYTKDKELGYDYVMDHCKSIKVCTQDAADKATGVSGDAATVAYVNPGNRSTVNVVDDTLVYASSYELAATLVHEATHCDRSVSWGEDKALTNEISCMLRLGMSKAAIQYRIDKTPDVEMYAAGIKLAQELLNSETK